MRGLARAGIATFDDLYTKQMTVGGTGGGADTDVFPQILNAVLGTKMKVITGYPGGNDVNLAMERGEVQGRCGWSWSSLQSTHKDWITDKKIKVLVQLALYKHPDLPGHSADHRSRQDRRAKADPQADLRPPGDGPALSGAARPAGGTRGKRCAQAFLDTMKDKDFLAEAEKAQLEINPVTGAGDREAGQGYLPDPGRSRRTRRPRCSTRNRNVGSGQACKTHLNAGRWVSLAFYPSYGARPLATAHGSSVEYRRRTRRSASETAHRRRGRPRPTQNYAGWQSDVIVDLIKRYDFPYITLNPGASFRGLHDSLVNYGDNKPPMMLCNHEEIAVQIAHGYAKATGKPMVVILHDLVGLLHACMAIYYAFLDRVPIFIMGATGPMDESKRRPHIDWTHTALVQGNAVRDYTKWDYQPTSIEGVPESFARAYSVMMTDPPGPIYMCYDAALQEAPKTQGRAAAARRHRQDALPHGARPARARGDRRQAAQGRAPAAAGRICRAQGGQFPEPGRSRRDDRLRGLGRQQRAQLPQQAPALPEHGQALAPADGSRAWAST